MSADGQSSERLLDRIKVGVAGWSYPDREGTVYPRPKSRGFDPPAFLADSFPVIEINSTFYHPGSERNARSWAERARGIPESRFAVLLERLLGKGLKSPALFAGIEEK